MLKIDENSTLGEAFNLNPDEYNDFDISALPFSIRVTKRLIEQNINTIKDLLFVTSSFLMNINGFGRGCIDQIYEYLEKLSNGNTCQSKRKSHTYRDNSFLARFKDMIALGDFSFINTGNFTDAELSTIEKCREAYLTIGEELVFDCICSPERIVPIIALFEGYQRRIELKQKIETILKTIPIHRRHGLCQYYIEAYSFDDIVRRRITSFYASENAELSSIIDTFNFEKESNVIVAERFLMWCAYDLKAQINELFEKLYADERIRQIVEARSQGQTLNEIGNHLNLTRERVRQLEAKAIKRFSHDQSQIRIMEKLYAEQNGKSIIAQDKIEELSENNYTALLFLLRQTESTFFAYDTTLDAFVVGESNMASRIQDYVDDLPDIIHKRDFANVLKEFMQEYDLDSSFLEKAINEAYRLTGDVYHKTRLSLTRIYEEILRTHYPTGIHVYDDNEISKLRLLIKEEYGDVALPCKNRAIAARIASIGMLAGRGIYIAKRKNLISKKLEQKIIKYIEENESPVLLIGMIFSEFEDELIEEGIDNRYYLQGILRELFGEQLFFKRDYVSRDKNFTSIYSSIITFIRQHQYPVKKEEIQERFKGITDIVISFATSDSDVLNFFGEYLHGSRLSIYEDERIFLFNYLNDCLSDNEAHHIKDIYPTLIKEKPTIFSRNAANMPYCMFSILEYLFRDQFQFSRPYIAKNGVEIEKSIERLKEMIYSEDEFAISDIGNFARDNHLQLQSIIDFINSLNDKFLMKNIDTLISIEKSGANKEIAKQIENVIVEEISDAIPIRNLSCINRFPSIGCDWTEWLIYSIIFKWGESAEVALSSAQLRQSLPIVSPKGKMNTSNYRNIVVSPVSIKIDNLDDIDELISDLITEDMLEDI